jgi:hypothetical protein
MRPRRIGSGILGTMAPTPFCSPSTAEQGRGAAGQGRTQDPRLSLWAKLCHPPRRADFFHELVT